MTATRFSVPRSLRGTLLAGGLSLVMALPIFWLQARTAEHVREAGAAPTQTDTVLSISSALPKFGARNLISDLLWLRFVQYFGDIKARARSNYGLDYGYLQAVTDSDPHFEQAYLITNLAVAYRMGRTDLAENLLIKGIHANPDSYRIWQSRGFLHFLYTGDIDKAVYSFRQNAGLAVAAGGNSMQRWGNYWLNISKYLLVSQSNGWTRRSIWKEVYLNAEDPETRSLSIVQLQKLGVVVKADGSLRELYPLRPPPGFAKQFVYGPPNPAHR